MKKILVLCLTIFLCAPFVVFATSETILTVNEIEFEEYSYENTFDNLIFDFTINVDAENTLDTLIIKNNGTARYGYEIGSIVLWADNGNNVFNCVYDITPYFTDLK